MRVAGHSLMLHLNYSCFIQMHSAIDPRQPETLQTWKSASHEITKASCGGKLFSISTMKGDKFLHLIFIHGNNGNIEFHVAEENYCTSEGN